jgi:hypothetical protein
MNKELFPLRPEAIPTIYAYEISNPEYKGLLKVGYTSKDVEKRVEQQFPIKQPDGKKPYRILFAESAMYSDGTPFTDHDIHRVLKKKGFLHEGGEWFRCTVDDVQAAYTAVRHRIDNEENRTQRFKMRPEQEEAVSKAIEYYAVALKEKGTRPGKFLWNAKMRFGKTFAAYQLAKRMGLMKVLILTFKPAAETAWREDLRTHIDFEGWQFVCRDGMSYEEADKTKPIVCFGSFQDYLGTNESGGIKAKNEWVHTTNWDLVIFDEYHFGAWRENAKKLFEQEDEDAYDSLDVEKYKQDEADNAYNETFLPITTRRYLYLSGTPFRALNSGEFIEEQIYNWTYSDEQRAKENFSQDNPDTWNPYGALPQMRLLTYQMPDELIAIASQGEFDEFDLNAFFAATGKGAHAEFKHKSDVQKWLDIIRGSYAPKQADNLKLRGQRPLVPYEDQRLREYLRHSFWFLPNVAACHAMANLLAEAHNTFWHDYKVLTVAGASAGIGLAALPPVRYAIGSGDDTKTITLSCGKLTTGVTVPQWMSIFMLRNLKSPETYFQAAFRVQSPWSIKNPEGDNPDEEAIKKPVCYVFDFAPTRALRQLSDYAIGLSPNETNPEKAVADLVSFLPVLASNGAVMKQVDAGEILDIAMAGTSGTLLARKWESALLVNVDNDTLRRILNNPEALEAVMRIEGFRALGDHVIETVINKSEQVKKTKQEKGDSITPKEKKQLSDEEKEAKSNRKKIQEKLIKFATRIPAFMYLTDFRENTLQDVITKLEPELFRTVTGLTVEDFNLLVSLQVFNTELMNQAVFAFRRYEDASLAYTGIDSHPGLTHYGLYDTVVTL